MEDFRPPVNFERFPSGDQRGPHGGGIMFHIDLGDSTNLARLTKKFHGKGSGRGRLAPLYAIANAVRHATGIRVRDVPITLDKLLAPSGDAEA